MTVRARMTAAALLVAALMWLMAAIGMTGPALASVPRGADLTGPVSWLAAGDSFSSGEGIRHTTGDCAQSPQAFGPRAAQLLKTQKNLAVSPFVFTACTGAVTTEFFNRPNKSRPTQAIWADSEKLGGVFDVVSLSFGGNDVDFGSVMKSCLDLPSWGEIVGSGNAGCDVNPDELARRVTNLEKGTGSASSSGPFGAGNTAATLASFYTQVANRHVTSDGTLVVVGYPRLLAPSDQWPSWRHDRCGQISGADADMLGDAAELLDAMMKRAATQADGLVAGGRSVAYVSRLDLFDHDGQSRSLCASAGTAWVNGVSSLWYAGRFESPYHPNEIGHLKTAERVAAVAYRNLNRSRGSTDGSTEGPSTEPTDEPTDEETISGGSSTYEIGEPFSESCSIAWPTAPSYTSSTIEMTTFCPNVPGQFTFVHVSYPDPDLPVTPSTGFMDVQGEIVDISTSGYGPKTLVVVADSVDLDP